MFLRHLVPLGHPLTFTENFTEIVLGEAFRRGVKRKKGSQIYRFWTSKAISWKRREIGGNKLVLTTRKWYVSFRFVPKSVTLNDLERRNGPYFALFHRLR